MGVRPSCPPTSALEISKILQILGWSSASNFKINSQSQEQFFLTVGQNNFGNKIQFFLFSLIVHGGDNMNYYHLLRDLSICPPMVGIRLRYLKIVVVPVAQEKSRKVRFFFVFLELLLSTFLSHFLIFLLNLNKLYFPNYFSVIFFQLSCSALFFLSILPHPVFVFHVKNAYYRLFA